MNRELIFEALFTRLEGLQTQGLLTTCSRLLRHWDDVDETEQPALFMAQGDQTAEKQLKGSPYKWNFNVTLYIYVKVPDGEAPAPVLNPILDAIEEILSPSVVEERQTLGGLCDTCDINGTIQTFEGTLGSQECAMVPILILVR